MLTTFLRTMKADTSGATAVEYGLMVGLIVIGMLVSLQLVATDTIGMWDHVEEKAVAAMTP
ncbi:Flp family type IVb pilin [Erythrobacter sp.]|uniref:Flp family type IVb pilin n=1 Tax=Erythrobacter sp. TaxID=1042 RepID=UPI0025E1CD54|nr:Flp family type IVb pilin [Erythrobacter sp.]